jgi:hypothetical protein
MTRNGKHTTYKNCDDRGMVYDIVLPTLLSLTGKTLPLMYGPFQTN